MCALNDKRNVKNPILKSRKCFGKIIKTKVTA